MAELILTEEEKAAPLWSDLSDEALGKLVKKKGYSENRVENQLCVAINLGGK